MYDLTLTQPNLLCFRAEQFRLVLNTWYKFDSAKRHVSTVAANIKFNGYQKTEDISLILDTDIVCLMYWSCVLFISHYSLPIYRRLKIKTARSLIWCVGVCAYVLYARPTGANEKRSHRNIFHFLALESCMNWAAILFSPQNAQSKVICRYFYI